MPDETCGYPTADGTPCQHPATDGDSCWIPAHGGDTENHGRPKRLDDERRQEIIFTAVSAGLGIERTANLAQVHPDSLRRYACCIDELRDPTLTTDDPCDFCERYVRADGRGALEVLRNCRPEYRAAASFGITDETDVNVNMDLDGDLTIDFDNVDT